MRYVLLVLGIMLVGFGFIWRLNVGQSLDYIRQQTTWPVTKATVLKQDAYYSKGLSPDAGGAFYPGFQYLYRVGDKEYRGWAFWGEEPSEDQETARALAMKKPYRPGRKVDIHYNPQAPKYSVFQPERSIPGHERWMGWSWYFINYPWRIHWVSSPAQA